MQISVAKVIRGLINLVYAVNLITIKATGVEEGSEIRCHPSSSRCGAQSTQGRVPLETWAPSQAAVF
jgi:hypothetical protein